MQSYIYSDLKGLINIDTLSTHNGFYYRVQKPVSINMSNFACRIAFYDINNLLLYYRHDTFAHWLKPFQSINLVFWSKQGNVVYFYEYARNKVYDSIFLHLQEGYCYRINEMQNNFAIVDSLQLKGMEYDEEDIIKKLQEHGLQRQPLIKDRIPGRDFFDRLFNRNKWYPE